ncbi:hypothetical protein GOV08_05625 [Candidatus Woesearchaeota archaeon]|nr:hypothetical protein [Candidatus Woesearchaeota archaeon]
MADEELKASIDKLTDAINNLFNLFKITADSLQNESHEDILKPLADKVNLLTGENEKIAKGIVTLADMVEEIKMSPSMQQIPQEQPITGPEPGNIPPLGPAKSDMHAPESLTQQGTPPLPRVNVPQMPQPPTQQQEKKKHGLFGFGK